MVEWSGGWRAPPPPNFAILVRMTEKQKTGALGEAIARRHLREAGYEIVAAGYRYKRVELDLIARKPDGCLVFVEVKTRRGLGYGHPSAAVTPAKERRMARAASAYMREVDHQWEVRFDIISVLLDRDDRYTLEHAEDAFFPGLF